MGASEGNAVYLFSPGESYESMNPATKEDFEQEYALIHGHLGAEWRPLVLDPVTEDAGVRYRKADLMEVASRVAARGRATAILADFLGGEATPLAAHDGRDPVTIFDPVHVLDAFDEETSEAKRYSEGGVPHVQRYVFKADVLAAAGLAMFKVPQLRRVFVTQKFVSAVQAASLTGLEFEFLWSEAEPMGRRLPTLLEVLLEKKPKPVMVKSPSGPLLALSRADADADPTFLFRRVKEAFGQSKRRLKGRQQALRLAIWYIDDVYNGGHYQYLHNKSPEDVEATIEGLHLLGADRHAEILAWSQSLFRATEVGPPPQDMEEFMAGAREGTFESIDNDFLADPTLGVFLNDYVTAHPEEFVSWT